MALFHCGSGSGSENIVIGVEKKTGTITIGGTTYTTYRKIVDCGATSANTEKRVDDTINAVGVLSSYATVKTEGGSMYNVVFVNPTSTYAYYNNNTIRLNTPTAAAQCLFIIEYYR